MKIAALRLATLSALVSLGAIAHADTVNIVNGNFESTATGQSAQLGTHGQSLTGWNGNGGYNFIFTPGAADTTGGEGNSGNVRLWGPGTGSNNGLTASPDGGNYMAMDGAYSQAPLTQTLTGLVVGDQVTVTFYYAGAQQYTFDGSTTEAFRVSLGDQTQDTPILDNVSHGFTGWHQASMTFTATSTSETLSFLALGTPSGVPPFSLLDGVSATQQSPVPEPGSLALLGTGITAAAGFLRRRLRKS
jgi:hypothetical protein